MPSSGLALKRAQADGRALLLNRDKIMQTNTALARPAVERRSFCGYCADAPHRWDYALPTPDPAKLTAISFAQSG
jgi:hypothetical protein